LEKEKGGKRGRETSVQVWWRKGREGVAPPRQDGKKREGEPTNHSKRERGAIDVAERGKRTRTTAKKRGGETSTLKRSGTSAAPEGESEGKRGGGESGIQ